MKKRRLFKPLSKLLTLVVLATFIPCSYAESITRDSYSNEDISMDSCQNLYDKDMAEEKANLILADSNASERSNEEKTPIIAFNKVYQGQIDDIEKMDMYALENTQGGKITVYMQVPKNAGIDYNIYLFKKNSQSGDVELVGGCEYPAAVNDNFSLICDEGVYVIAVGLKKLDVPAEPYYFTVTHTIAYSSYEPNDNLFQIKQYTLGEEYKDTIDNQYDEDCFHFDIPEDGKYVLTIDNPASNVKLQSELQDQNLNIKLHTDKNGEYEIDLEKGFHIIRFLSEEGYNIGTEYTFSIKKKDEAVNPVQVPARAEITDITSPGVGGYIPYPQGRRWRVKTSCVVYGKLYDENNNPAGGIPVRARMFSKFKNDWVIGEYVTKADGTFEITMPDLSHAVGEYEYYGPVSYHYYDIAPFEIQVNGITMRCNESSVYHFAYSKYHKF